MLSKQVIIALVILIAAICANDIGANQHIKVQQNFRKLGHLATGLSYGHIHATIKFNKLKHAVHSVLHVLKLRHDQSTSEVEKQFINTLQPQLQIAQDSLDDLHDLFFGDNDARSKRQLFLGLAFALGIFNTGMSIYNTAEIAQLHSQITGLKTDMLEGFRHVTHVLEEDQHVLHQIVNNVNVIKESCRYALDQINNQQDQIRTIQNMIEIGAFVSNLNAELAAWARGLESLSHGTLHPTLVNKSAMKKAFESLQEKGMHIGLKTLHKSWMSVYKNKISYFSTKNEDIIVMVHIPLVEQDPLELLEYLPIPIKLENMFLMIEGSKNIFATDLQGQQGLEMSSTDLLRCQTEDLHHGKLFICPDTNLLQNQVRKTCLGSIYFGHQNEVVKKCNHFVNLHGDQTEFMKQISEDTVILFSKEDLTVRQVCSGVISTIANLTGLTSLTVTSGCKLVTEEFTFRSPVIIDQQKDFIKKTMKIPSFKLFNGTSAEEIEFQLKKLESIQKPDRIHLDTLKKWIREEKRSNFHQTAGYAVSTITLIIGLIMISAMVFLFLRYKRNRPTQN